MTFRPLRPLAPAVALLLLSSACDKKDPPAATTPSAATAAASSAAPAKGAPSASATGAATAAKKPGDAKAKAKATTEAKVTVEKRAEYKKLLADGRKLAGEKKWAASVTAFEAALAANPGDPRALAELGYAAYHADDLAKAAATNTKALEAATDPQLRAQVLFNEGMVAEKQNNKDLAKKSYEASLKLRPNTTVEKRLTDLGGAVVGTCDKSYPTIDALCTCLKTNEKDSIMSLEAATFACTEKPQTVPGLTVLRWGAGGDADEYGEHPWILLAKAADGWRKVADLGSDYSPGAFGVNNETSVDSVTSKTIDGRTVAEITWYQHDYDANMAGLEAETYDTKNVTICVLGPVPKCAVTIPVEETSAVIYPIEPEDDEAKKEIAEMKKENPEKSDTKTATYTIDGTGLVTVKETKGSRPFLAPLVKGVKLW